MRQRITCLLAISLTFAAVGVLSGPDARAASTGSVVRAGGHVPASTSSLLPVAILGIGDEDEPDENEPDEGGEDSAASGQSTGSAPSAVVLLLLAGLGLVAVGFAARLLRRVRDRFRRFVRAL